MDMMPATEKASRTDDCNKARLRIGDDLRRDSFENASNEVEGLKNYIAMRNKPLLRLNFQNINSRRDCHSVRVAKLLTASPQYVDHP